jgi:hypothetical protein
LRAAQRLRKKKFTAKSKTGKGEEAKEERENFVSEPLRLFRLRGKNSDSVSA